MDPSHYPAFRPLLEKLKPYSDLTGARFDGRSFDDLTAQLQDESEGTIPERMRIKLESIAEVQEFTKRLREEDHALTEEFHRAARLVMHEAVRQGIMATLRELNLWPSSDDKSSNSNMDDIGWEDMATDIHTVARRCYNYEILTTTDPLYSDLKSQRITGSFVMDFCTYALRDQENQVFSTSSSSDMIMKDFIEMVRQYQDNLDRTEASRWATLKKTFVKAMTSDGRWEKSWVQAEKVERWWGENHSKVLVGSLLVAGAFAVGAYAFSKTQRLQKQ